MRWREEGVMGVQERDRSIKWWSTCERKDMRRRRLLEMTEVEVLLLWSSTVTRMWWQDCIQTAYRNTHTYWNVTRCNIIITRFTESHLKLVKLKIIRTIRTAAIWISLAHNSLQTSYWSSDLYKPGKSECLQYLALRISLWAGMWVSSRPTTKIMSAESLSSNRCWRSSSNLDTPTNDLSEKWRPPPTRVPILKKTTL